MELITTHTSVDLDALACVVAARRLYPDAVAALPDPGNPNVRELVRVHGRNLGLVAGRDVDLHAVRRLVLVDTSHVARTGRFAALGERGDVELVVLDHHGGQVPGGASAASLISDDGALATTMVELLAARDLDPSPLEATLLALGIHEDTGSLTFPATTERDVEALAWCMRRGADPHAIGRFLRLPLPASQLALFEELTSSLEPVEVEGVEVALASGRSDVYEEGVSELARHLLDVSGRAALVCLVELAGRTLCVVRSHDPQLDAGALARALGGDGHPAAASAALSEPLAEALARVRRELPGVLVPARAAAEVMRVPLPVGPSTPAGEALGTLRDAGASAALVLDGSALVGSVRLSDLERAVAHGLAAAPVRAIMAAPVPRFDPSVPAATVERAAARTPAAVVAIGSDDGIVGAVEAAPRSRPAPPEAGSLAEPLFRLPGLGSVFEAIDAAGAGVRGVYLVGGAVRDLLLGARSIDLDLVVEGDGPAFARSLARALHGRATVHERFATSAVTFAGGRIDVATARTELYAAPGALPRVAAAAIEDDLHRRDFTINAMAVSLRAADFGRLVDPFHGRRDLEHARVRVLHPLSFVDDPTRLFRAARYASRLRFSIAPGTLALARNTVELRLVERLSGHRLADELVLLLSEPRAWEALAVLADLGVLAALDAGLVADEEGAAIAARAEALREEHTPEVPAWRLHLAALARQATPDRLAAWLDTLELRRADAERIADAVACARHLPGALAAVESPAGAYALARPHDPDGVLLALASVECGRGHDWLLRYLLALRDVRLELTGHDLAALGLPESPRVGAILDELRRRRLDGELAGREAELAAARELIASGWPDRSASARRPWA